MKVIIIDGVPYTLTPLREEAREACLKKVREKQVEIYVDNCKEPSTEIVEGRVYEI